MKVITDGMEQIIDLLANDTLLQLPTFRHEVMPSSQSHQVGQTPTRSHHGNIHIIFFPDLYEVKEKVKSRFTERSLAEHEGGEGEEEKKNTTFLA